MSWCTFLFATTDIRICFDDVGEFMRQVVFSASFTFVIDTGSNWRRRDRQHSDNHPFGLGVFLVQTHLGEIFAGDVSEDSQYFGGRDELFLCLNVLQ